jgi:DNA-binding NarL/FixJ family response regulator
MAQASPISVLILDDEAHIRKAIRHYLQDEGRFAVSEAATADDAFSVLERDEVRVCLVDLRLKGTDGFAFIEKAREHHPGVRFLIQTGSFEADVRERARLAGVDDDLILLKPFPLEALVRAIDRALDGGSQ